MKKDTDVAYSSEWKKPSLTTVGLLYSHGSVRYEWNRLLTNFAEFSYMCQCLLSCRYNMLKSQHCCFLRIISRSTVYSLLHIYFFSFSMLLFQWKSPGNSLHLKYWICMFSRLPLCAEISCHHHCRCSSFLFASKAF